MDLSYNQLLIEELKRYQQFILNNYIPNETMLGQIPFFYIPMNAIPCKREKQITDNEFEGYSFSTRDLIFTKHKTERCLNPACSMNTDLISSGPLYDRILFLGDPGFGKTHLLKWVLHEWAQTDLHEKTTPVPFLINISDYYHWQVKGSKSIKRYLEETTTSLSNKLSTMLNTIFRSGCFSLLLDGLDEVSSPSDQKEIVQDIISFLDTYSPQKTIITSRFYNVAHNYWLGSNFKVFTLDKESLNTHTFMEKWQIYSSINDWKSKHIISKEYFDSFKVKDICNLLNTPLFTYLYASSLKSNNNVRHSFSFVEKCVECLIDWKQPSTIFSKTQILTLLKDTSYLVKTNQNGCTGNQIPSTTLKGITNKALSSQHKEHTPDTVDNIADQLCYQGFIHYSSNKDTYRFAYNAFLDYFFSLEVLDRVKSKSLSFEELKSQFFVQYCPQKYWQEVLCYIAISLPTDQIDYLVTALLHHEYHGKSAITRIFFLAKVLLKSDIPELMDKYREVIIQKLKQILFMPFESGSVFSYEDKNIKTKIEAMIFYTSLLKTTDPISHYIENFIDKAPSPEIRQMALQQIIQSPEATLDHQKLILLLSGESGQGISCHVSDHQLIEKYSSCIYNIFSDYVKEPDPLKYKEKILTDKLAQSLNTNLDFAFKHLRQTTRSYGSWRDAILSLMGQYFHKKKEFRNLCIQVAKHDESFWARYYAQETLAIHYNNDPEILSVVMYCAYHDEFQGNRTHCIKLIMTHWPQPETLNSMNSDIFHDNETFIRHQIIEILVVHRDVFPNTFEILAECLKKDPNEDTTLVAINGIALYWDDDEKARKALIECILNNKDDSVLRIACNRISARWPNDPEVKEIIDKHKPEY